MYRYFATFISGTQMIVESILNERLPDVKINKMMDGAVDFTTSISYDSLNLYCFNNIFGVIDTQATAFDEDCLNNFIRYLFFKGIRKEDLVNKSTKVKTFRIVASVENQLVSIDAHLKQKLENYLAKSTGLNVSRANSDTEFWLLYRSERICYFLKRLSKHTSYDKLLNKGELHPELAYILCKISNPKHTDIVLDPFCGYGSIPYQRCKKFPFAKLYAFDINEKALQVTKSKFYKKCDNIIIETHNVKDLLNRIPTKSLDAIITDPPWGYFEDVEGGISQFYYNFMSIFDALLKEGGILVLLTAKKEEFSRVLKLIPSFQLVDTYNILVSGKKSAIYKIVKTMA